MVDNLFPLKVSGPHQSPSKCSLVIPTGPIPNSERIYRSSRRLPLITVGRQRPRRLPISVVVTLDPRVPCLALRRTEGVAPTQTPTAPKFFKSFLPKPAAFVYTLTLVKAFGYAWLARERTLRRLFGNSTRRIRRSSSTSLWGRASPVHPECPLGTSLIRNFFTYSF